MAFFFHSFLTIVLETVHLCPVCGHHTFNSILTCNDYLVSNQKFTIQQCQNCDFRLTNPRPDANSISSYYKSDQYISHNDKSNGIVNSVYKIVRNYTLRSKINLITDLNKGKSNILDVGCGTGSFLEGCKTSGWNVSGMEPDADARAVAEKKLQTDVYPSLEALKKANSFDVITLWHVLEHIPNLNETILQLHQLLTDKGTLLIAVPNSDSYDAAYFRQYWAAYDVPRHLHHFTPSTIEPLFKKCGFVLIDKKPMVFDAFYIAMLSTRYKTGKTDYLKSVQIGLASNAEAKRSGNSSSLTYIFKKA